MQLNCLGCEYVDKHVHMRSSKWHLLLHQPLAPLHILLLLHGGALLSLGTHAAYPFWEIIHTTSYPSCGQETVSMSLLQMK